jgi:hypothetical protein
MKNVGFRSNIIGHTMLGSLVVMKIQAIKHWLVVHDGVLAIGLTYPIKDRDVWLPLLLEGKRNRVGSCKWGLSDRISITDFLARYHLSGIVFFLFKIFQLFLPIWTAVVPQVEIDWEAITLERSQLINKKTNLTARNREPENHACNLKNIEIRGWSTNGLAEDIPLEINTDGICIVQKKPPGRIPLKRTPSKTQSVCRTFARLMPRDLDWAESLGRGRETWKKRSLPWLERRGGGTSIMAGSQGSARWGWELPEPFSFSTFPLCMRWLARRL